MNVILVILFPNGQMQIACDNFFPCQQQYIKMLDKVIAISDNPMEYRKWLMRYLKYRINTEHKDKDKTKLKKNFDFICTRFEKEF